MKHGKEHFTFLKKAIELSKQNLLNGEGGPFGALVVKDNKIISESYNQVLVNNDPTAHAEITAIREACNKLGTYQLTGCIIYTSCEPCPMCLGAIYWARPEKVYFANTRKDAASVGFDDEFIYQEIIIDPDERSIPMYHLPDKEAAKVLDKWMISPFKKAY
jgi:guanine deaminase